MVGIIVVLLRALLVCYYSLVIFFCILSRKLTKVGELTPLSSPTPSLVAQKWTKKNPNYHHLGEFCRGFINKGRFSRWLMSGRDRCCCRYSNSHVLLFFKPGSTAQVEASRAQCVCVLSNSVTISSLATPSIWLLWLSSFAIVTIINRHRRRGALCGHLNFPLDLRVIFFSPLSQTLSMHNYTCS